MKLVLLLIVQIAVFEANCRGHTVGSDGALKSDFDDGQASRQTFELDHQLKHDVNGKNHAELRGKADKKLLKQISNGVEDNGGKLDLIIEAIENLSVTQGCGCPVGDNWVENNGNCFYFSTDTATWQEARDICKALGLDLTPKRNCDLAELGNPNNLGSDYWLMETIGAKASRFRWLGAYSPNEDGQWIWARSGRALSLSFPMWPPSQPSGDGYCLNTLLFGENGPDRANFNDAGCDYAEAHYVCQLF